MRRRFLAPLLAALAGAPEAAAQTDAMLAASARSVLRVVASECEGEARAGSGFAWRDATAVVTALHVVAGCRGVRVGVQGGAEYPARVERVLAARDLALLRVDRLPVPPLTETMQMPAANATVWVVGFALGQPTRDSRPLHVGVANQEAPLLTHALPDAVREELRRFGSPRLDTEVVRVDGNLLPGLSGAPLVDEQGRVVGVGSGGLQRGTVGTGWAVRARYLVELAASAEAPPATGRVAGPLFATAAPDAAAIRCGELELHRTRTLELRTLMETNDDPAGLQQLAAVAGRPAEALLRLRFDVWTEPASGLAVALPAAARLGAGGAGCVVRLSPEIEMQVGAARMARVAGVPDPRVAQVLAAQAPSQAFEFAWAREFLPFLQPNPMWTYWTPRPAGTGVVRRGLYEGWRPLAPAGQLAFQTLVARDASFLGVVAINRGARMGMRPSDEWVAAVLGTFLTTSP